MDLAQAVKSCFKQYSKSDGRAARSEYWYWILFGFLAHFITNLIDVLIFHVQYGEIHPISLILSLVLLLPGINVGIRRLHDVNRSGWWMLLPITIIGIIPLLAWNISKGTAGDNRFGPDPLAGEKA